MDLWVDSEEEKLNKVISNLIKKLVELEQELYVIYRLVNDKEFMVKFKVDSSYHQVRQAQLKAEIKEVKKFIYQYTKDLSRYRVEGELENE